MYYRPENVHVNNVLLVITQSPRGKGECCDASDGQWHCRVGKGGDRDFFGEGGGGEFLVGLAMRLGQQLPSRDQRLTTRLWLIASLNSMHALAGDEVPLARRARAVTFPWSRVKCPQSSMWIVGSIPGPHGANSCQCVAIRGAVTAPCAAANPT